MQSTFDSSAEGQLFNGFYQALRAASERGSCTQPISAEKDIAAFHTGFTATGALSLFYQAICTLSSTVDRYRPGQQASELLKLLAILEPLVAQLDPAAELLAYQQDIAARAAAHQPQE